MKIQRITFLVIIFMLTACHTASQRFHNYAIDKGFQSKQITGKPFEHIIYTNVAANKLNVQQTLHIYLDGDGSPWHNQRWLNKDPTSRNPLILKLMQQDLKPSILLGRPCYHGLNNSIPCHSRFWSSQRYSQIVVDSMVQALQHWLVLHPAENIVFIGYSGGGALALLIAPYIIQTQKIISIAANLDTDAWSQYHGYAPFSESLNPATQAKLNPAIKQFHLIGLEDRIVPAIIAYHFVEQQTHGVIREFPKFNHRCCWDKVWRSVLEELEN